jgi:hypothetical protein
MLNWLKNKKLNNIHKKLNNNLCLKLMKEKNRKYKNSYKNRKEKFNKDNKNKDN